MKARDMVCSLAMVVALVACGGSKEEKQDNILRSETVEHGLTVMPVYDYHETVEMGSHEIEYSLHRESSDSLAVVEDENGDRFADNFYVLTIKKDGTSFFSHRFTKASFAQYLDEGFKSKAILDGFRFSEAKEGCIYFGACISYPESDMSAPFVVTIDSNGNYAISPDDVLDVDEMEDDADGV